MNMKNFVVAAWRFPHSEYGELVEIDCELVTDGTEWAAVQSGEFVNRRSPELDLDKPHQKINVTIQKLEALALLCDKTEYSFQEHPFTAALGGTWYGLRISRGFQTATITWQGKFEDQSEGIRKMHSAIYKLAEA